MGVGDDHFKVRMVFGATITDDRYVNPRPPPLDPEHPAHLGDFCWCKGNPGAPHDYSTGVAAAAAALLREAGSASDDARPRQMLQGLLQAYDECSRKKAVYACRLADLERTDPDKRGT